MTQLFEPTTINGMTLDNRFVRSATWEGMAGDDGSATPALTRTMTDLANGGVGLIISGHAYVVKDGQAGPWQLGMHDDGLVPGLLNMTDAVHDAGGKIVAQLAHSGHFTPKSLTGAPPQVVSEIGRAHV
jgi:2,4-dienoyl-CoA reductase-like NADH-dependent reductase (Old Yellow Enzyme family)